MNAEHVAFSALLAGVVLSSVMLIKIEVAYHWQIKIIDAIREYIMHKYNNKEYQSVEEFDADSKMIDEIEPLEETIYRLTDWGYKRIVPPEIFEKIRPYIK